MKNTYQKTKTFVAICVKHKLCYNVVVERRLLKNILDSYYNGA